LAPRPIWLLAAVLVVATSAAAHAASMTATLDRDAVAPDQPFVYEVRLTLASEQFERFRPPEFRGFQVLSAPRAPSQSTQVTMMGAQMNMQQTLTWQYQLQLAPGQKGPLTIGAAHARVGDTDVASNAVTVRVGAPGSAAPPAAPAQRPGLGLFPRGLFDDFDAQQQPRSSSAGAAFVRAAADKQRAFVGEQITVTWTLYVTEQPGQLEPRTQPRTDGFWSEDIPSTNPQGRLSFAPEMVGGRSYQAAVLSQKALFPLAPGKLTVTPFEVDASRVDFFGRAVRSQRLKSEPLTIEALPLPREGQPAGFAPSNVGHYTLRASADRTQVAVGDAVTLTLTVHGDGNVRNVRLPELPPLPGWKAYEPKTDVQTEGGATVAGTKTVEWLLRPEQPGKTVIPAYSLPTFEPTAKRYQEVKSEPLALVVTGEAPVAGGAPSAPGTATGAPAPPAAGVENVIGTAIRPIRTRSRPHGEVGLSLARGLGLAGVVAVPPLAFAALVLGGRVRRRLSGDTDRNRRRRARSQARRRLAAAESHRAAGRVSAFYVEVDRVLRERLAERLGVPVGGLRLDELGAVLAARGFAPADAERLVRALEASDEARFAPSGAAASPEALAGALAEAESLIDLIDRTPLKRLA
jgi:hypothetical protein